LPEVESFFDDRAGKASLREGDASPGFYVWHNASGSLDKRCNILGRVSITIVRRTALEILLVFVITQAQGQFPGVGKPPLGMCEYCPGRAILLGKIVDGLQAYFPWKREEGDIRIG
jgi:hypothetical protein